MITSLYAVGQLRFTLSLTDSDHYTANLYIDRDDFSFTLDVLKGL